MTTQSTIDWIEGSSTDETMSPEILIKLAASVTGLHPDGWRHDRGFNKYKLCVRHKTGVQALSGTKGNGSHYIASGQAISALARAGIGQLDWIVQLATHGMHATRYDLALDCVNMKINPSVLFTQSRARTPYLIKSGEGGLTLYIGAQQSDRHIRMYNKEAEIDNKADIPPGVKDWIRIEITLMREFARYGHQTIIEAGIDTATRSHITEFVNFPKNKQFLRSLAGERTEIGLSTKRITDTQAWLLDVVAKTVAKQMALDEDFLWKFITQAKYEFDNLPE